MNKMPISDVYAIASGAMSMEAARDHEALRFGGGEARYLPCLMISKAVDYILIIADDEEETEFYAEIPTYGDNDEGFEELFDEIKADMRDYMQLNEEI